MHRIVCTIHAQASLESAARQMLHDNVGLLPVVEEVQIEDSRLHGDVFRKIGFLPLVEEDVLVGVITTRDIVVRAIARGKDPHNTPVSEIMTHNFACCHEDDEIADALAAIKENEVRRLFVMNREDKIVGIVSRGDIWSAVNGLS
jgi:CBS domain-containing protein